MAYSTILQGCVRKSLARFESLPEALRNEKYERQRIFTGETSEAVTVKRTEKKRR